MTFINKGTAIAIMNKHQKSTKTKLEVREISEATKPDPLLAEKHKVAMDDLARFIEIQENLEGLGHDQMEIETFKLYLKVKSYAKKE